MRPSPRHALSALCISAVVLLSTADSRADAPTGAAILNGQSNWRYHVALRRPIVPAGEGRSVPAVLDVRVAYRSYPGLEQLETAPPPQRWFAADFDDSSWPRGPVQGRNSLAAAVFRPGVGHSTGMLCLRGKFAVRDPASVRRLSLSLSYRGGVVVRLNGREVARGHLPDGELKSDTPGQGYPPEAFAAYRGTPPGEVASARSRSLGPLRLPADALRTGVNVLAIELRRSDYGPQALTWFRGGDNRGEWTPVGLEAVELTAEGPGAAPNVARPAGFQLFNRDVNDRVSVLDYGDPNEPLVPITLWAARNGAFSSQVVAGSTGPIRGLRVTPGELRAAGGGVIPSAAVQVRFGVPNGRAYNVPDWFDGLSTAPPDPVPVHERSGAALLPLWITVHVPRDAAPGEYRGQAIVSAGGVAPTAVPVVCHVADWALPDPKDFRTYVGVYQSPTSLAMQYSVPMWSEAHWKLMERSFELLGLLGNKIVNIPVVEQTQFGDDEGFVRWVRRPDGTYDYDFSIFDRYLALVRKHLVKPDFVALQVWHSGGWETRPAEQKNTVTVIDPRTGRRIESLQVPPFGTEASKAFFKPVLDAIRARLAAHGLAEAMCLGVLSDGTAPPAVFKAFDEIVPGGAKWTRGCHSVTRAEEPYSLLRGGGGTVACHEFCYGMAQADPAKGLPQIWKQRARPGIAFIRHNFDDTLSLLKYRTFAERALYCGTRGVGRTGLDYWDVVPGGRGQASNIFNRWPHSSCAQRAPNMWRLSWPGPDGAEPTVRFEQFRQGVQSADAMIIVAEAAFERADRLGPELTERCRGVFLDRLNYCRSRTPESYGTVLFGSWHEGWADLDRRLYAAAAEAASRLNHRHGSRGLDQAYSSARPRSWHGSHDWRAR